MTTDTKDIGPQIRMQLDQMVDHLNNMPIGASLVWLWSWDLIRDKYNTYKDIHDYDDYVITEGTTLDKIWDKLWASPPSEFTLEYGAEFIDEAIIDWLIDNEFLAILEDDGWLEDSDDNEDADNQSN